MKRILRIGKGVKARRARVKEICELPVKAMAADIKAEVIQALIPIGLWHVKELLEEEVKQIAGERYKRSVVPGYDRWGKAGWVCIPIGPEAADHGSESKRSG